MWALDLLHDYRVARILLPLQGKKVFPFDCVVRTLDPPLFEVTFLPDQFPASMIDPEGRFVVSFDLDGRTYSLHARHEEMEPPDKLRLVALETVSHVQKREFFRIDAEISLIYRRLSEKEKTPIRQLRSLVNLSGGGIRFSVNEPLSLKEKLALRLHLSEPSEEEIPCVGQVVRSPDLEKGDLAAALQFVDIEQKDRDRIVAFCFAEQRKRLRTKVRILDF